jgi:hypothetical protein
MKQNIETQIEKADKFTSEVEKLTEIFPNLKQEIIDSSLIINIKNIPTYKIHKKLSNTQIENKIKNIYSNTFYL